VDASLAGADGKRDVVGVYRCDVETSVRNGQFCGRDSVLNEGIQKMGPIRTRVETPEGENRRKFVPFDDGMVRTFFSGDTFFKILTELRECIPYRRKDPHARDYHASLHVLITPFGYP
jgi:hypothetical protein